MRHLSQEATNALWQYLQPEGSCSGRSMLFQKKTSDLKTTCQKDNCGLSFEFFFFPSILERNGHAIHLPSFVSFCLVQVGLQLCNSKELKHIASVGINENQFLGEQKNKSTLIFASSNTKHELQVFFRLFTIVINVRKKSRLTLEIRSKKETML